MTALGWWLVVFGQGGSVYTVQVQGCSKGSPSAGGWVSADAKYGDDNTTATGLACCGRTAIMEAAMSN